jgi:S-(hydroxymethyl)glutathione dehydrogenase/alcohol dehydrogenase
MQRRAQREGASEVSREKGEILMKAALLTEINQPLVLADVEPRDLLPGQVLVRVLVSGICGAQLQEIRGEKGTHFPRLMGHEGCGIVHHVGPGVTKLKEGQKVVMHWRKGFGAESESPRYVYEGKMITGGQVTTFSEFSVCSENRLTAVPIETPNELCALLGCGLSTALGVMENEAKLKAGESVLIVGCGGVGLNLIRVARMMGAAQIIGVDGHDKLVEVIKAGAHAFSFAGLGLNTGQYQFDVIVDTTGNVDAIESALPMLAPSGRMILVGQPKPGADLILHGARHLFDGEGKTIKATQGGGFVPDRDIPRYVNMWRSRHLKIDGIITHRYPFAQINEALDAVRSGSAGRALLEMV